MLDSAVAVRRTVVYEMVRTNLILIIVTEERCSRQCRTVTTDLNHRHHRSANRTAIPTTGSPLAEDGEGRGRGAEKVVIFGSQLIKRSIFNGLTAP